jgi:flagellar motor switch protein FliN/FliY
MADMSIANTKMPDSDAALHSNIQILSGISVRVSVEVGSTTIALGELVNLAEGSVIELDRQANDLLDVLANGTLVAKGEIVAIDGRYGVRIVAVSSSETRAKGVERRS